MREKHVGLAGFKETDRHFLHAKNDGAFLQVIGDFSACGPVLRILKNPFLRSLDHEIQLFMLDKLVDMPWRQGRPPLHEVFIFMPYPNIIAHKLVLYVFKQWLQSYKKILILGPLKALLS
jgi:hypothetical protein